MQARYQIRTKLGSGTYGDIYECEDVETGNIYVLKKLKGSSLFSQILREISTMQKFSNGHPNIISLVEVVGNTSPEMIMEKVPLTLLQFIGCFGAYGMPLTYIKRITRDILRVCSFLHSRRLMHRDLKPENVLISIRDTKGDLLYSPTDCSSDLIPRIQALHRGWREGDPLPLVPVVKVCDFGMCRMVLPDDAAEPQQERCPTPRSSTMSYRSPEMMLGRPDYSFAVDVWAVGCILAEMATCCLLVHYYFYNDDNGDKGPEEQWPNLINLLKVIGSPTPKQWLSLTHQPLMGPMNEDFPRFHSTLESFCNGALPRRLGANGMDFLMHILAIVPEERLTAAEALEHPFFADVDN